MEQKAEGGQSWVETVDTRGEGSVGRASALTIKVAGIAAFSAGPGARESEPGPVAGGCWLRRLWSSGRCGGTGQDRGGQMEDWLCSAASRPVVGQGPQSPPQPEGAPGSCGMNSAPGQGLGWAPPCLALG